VTAVKILFPIQNRRYYPPVKRPPKKQHRTSEFLNNKKGYILDNVPKSYIKSVGETD